MNDQRSCLITGAGGLIGQGLVTEFLRQGYFVYLVDKKEPEDLPGENVRFFKADTGSEEDVRQIASEVPELNVLINNAAIADPKNAPVQEFALKDWERIIHTNLTGYFLLIKYFTPQLKKAKEASIINIASTRALMSEPHNEAYAAAKGGILALTHALANSLGPKIRVNAISPGWIADPNADLADEDHKQHPVGRVGRPSDIASAASYLASEASSFVTGTNMVIDGGMTHKMIYK